MSKKVNISTLWLNKKSASTYTLKHLHTITDILQMSEEW